MDPIIWSLLLGVVASHVTSFLKDPKWSQQIKALLTYGVAIVFAVGQALIMEHSTWQQIVKNSAGIIASASAFYHLYFVDTKINKTLEDQLHK